MAHKKITSVQQYATGTGTGALSLGTTLSALYRTMQAAGMANGDTAYVMIRHATIPSEWEIVLVTYASSGSTITPSFDSKSVSATGALISFSAGNKVVTEARHDGVDWITGATAGPANVADFGAVADGTTDCLVAFDAAVLAGNGCIVIPPGDYLLSGALELSGYYHTSIAGSARGITKLIFQSGGIVVTTDMSLAGTGRTNSNHTLRDLMIQTTSTGLADTAVTYRCSPDRTEAFVTISDIDIVGGDGVNGDFISINGTSHTSTLIDGIASTAGVSVNDMWFGSGVPTNAYVVSKTATSVTLDRATSSSVTTTFQHYGGPTQGWLSGIKLENIWGTNIHDVRIDLYGAIGATGSKGIEIAAEDDVALFDYEWSGINVRGSTTAVYVRGWVEGLLVTNCNFYACRDALDMLHATDPLVGTMCFVNCAFTCSRIPVQIDGLHTLQFVNCQFYQAFGEQSWMPAGSGRIEDDGVFWYPGSVLDITVDSTSGNYAGLLISNCVLYSALASSSPAILLTDVRGFVINGLQVTYGSFTYLFSFAGTTSGRWDNVDLRGVTLASGLVTNSSSENVQGGSLLIDGYPASWWSDARAAFSANDTTPSVAAAQGKSAFYTANTGATTITQFDGAVVGQVFRIVVNDANTTFQHNANLLLRGGIDYVGSAGDVLTFLQEGASYSREISRLTAVMVATTGTFSSYIKNPSTTVAGLPAAGTAGTGARWAVTDANATTFLSVVAGGGANHVPVFCDGSNWRIG